MQASLTIEHCLLSEHPGFNRPSVLNFSELAFALEEFGAPKGYSNCVLGKSTFQEFGTLEQKLQFQLPGLECDETPSENQVFDFAIVEMCEDADL